MTTDAFCKRVRSEMVGLSVEAAKRGIGAVFHALRDRLTPEEADQAAAQLPSELKALWEAGETPGRQPVKLHRQQFYERVRAEAELPSVREARTMTLAVFAALKEQLSPGEVEDVWAQLPKDLKEVWEEAR